mgnify:CR=1 FL=1
MSREVIKEKLQFLAGGRDPRTAILTTHGKLFWITDPRPQDVDVRDIAQGIGSINRFIGHGEWPITVATHSLLLSKLVPEEFREQAIWHDATEAYMLDLLHPLKERVFKGYSEIEDRLFGVICNRFNFPFVKLSPDFHQYDRRMGCAELMCMFPQHGIEYLEMIGITDKDIDAARNWMQWVHYNHYVNSGAEWLLEARLTIQKYANR